MSRLYIAVDGGNSKTDVVIGSSTGAVLGTASGPGSSPHVLGVPGTVTLLDSLVRTARAAAGLPLPVVLDRADVYLAGADLPTEIEVLNKAVGGAGWAREHRVDNDTFALLRAGTDVPDAVAVVCGAGINCAGRTAGGHSARFPSLGQISGDWGGGHHLAELTLYYAARGEDGRDSATSLSARVAATLGRATVAEVSADLHLGGIPAGRVYELAPLLFAAADEGDPVAKRVVARQATEIVSLVRVVAGRLGLLDADYAVVFGGGVLTARHALLNDAAAAGIRAHSPRATVSVLEHRPITGAALLALDALGADATADAHLRAALAT
ncbi:MAG TPA: BadF/BadG/BcrA/BcrD ATPase family protein [Micromonosporaceae bacterium]|nr:BadF/BadG/BcrA/BcrD ATPase family protein [Micromonosporaceae bacterium]